MELAKYIQDLLYRYECVILPGFGAFLSQRYPAKLDKEKQNFYPPKKVLSFNRQLSKNDGLLANYVAHAEQLSYTDALQKLYEFANQLNKELVNKDQIKMPNIGAFSYNAEEGIVHFEPDTTTNYLTDSFGLNSFKTNPVLREVYKEQAQSLEEKAPVHLTPERRKLTPYLKYAAVGIVALGIAGFLGLNSYSKQVSEHNVAEQQKAENQLEQKIQKATFVIDNPLPAITLNVEKQSGNYHIVAGAFRDKENAHKKLEELRKQGYKARLLGENKYGLHQVVYSSIQERGEALKMLHKVKKENPAAWLLVKEL